MVGQFHAGLAQWQNHTGTREIHVYGATRWDSVAWVAPPPLQVNPDQIDCTYGIKGTGFYELSLPPGKYSFLVLEDSLFSAREGDGAGHYASATVLPGKNTERQIDITYGAGF